MKQFFVPHPGALLREQILPALGLTVTAAARQLGVSRPTFARLIHEQCAVSAEMASRLEQWITNPPAITWLQMQNSRDMWELAKKGLPKVSPVIRGANATD